MGFILISVIMAIAVWLLYTTCSSPHDRTLTGKTTIMTIMGIMVSIGVTAGLLANLGQYGPMEEVEVTELRSLYDDEEKYIKISPKNTYTYRIYAEDFVSSSGDAYAFRTLEGDSVTLIEENDNLCPRLVKYIQKHQKNFWTFALESEKYYYAFYIPKGTTIAGLSAS